MLLDYFAANQDLSISLLPNWTYLSMTWVAHDAADCHEFETRLLWRAEHLTFLSYV